MKNIVENAEDPILIKLIKDKKYPYTLISYLILKGRAPLEDKDKSGLTALIIASRHNLFEIVELLLIGGADPNIFEINTRYRDTALSWSSYLGYSRITELLIQHGSNKNYQTQIYGYTPLMWALKQSKIEDFIILIDSGADPNIKHFNGKTVTQFCINRPGYLNYINRFRERVGLIIYNFIWNKPGAELFIVKIIMKYY